MKERVYPQRPVGGRLAMVALVCLAAGCASPHLTTTWTDPSYSGPPFAAILVVATPEDGGLRAALEDEIVGRLRDAGVAAFAAHPLFPAEAPADGPLSGPLERAWPSMRFWRSASGSARVSSAHPNERPSFPPLPTGAVRARRAGRHSPRTPAPPSARSTPPRCRWRFREWRARASSGRSPASPSTRATCGRWVPISPPSSSRRSGREA
jgi:hypothetical protein